MNNMISYITLNDSTLIKTSILILGDQEILLNNLNIGKFSQSQRKTVLGIGLQGDVSPPSASLSKSAQNISIENFEVDLTQNTNPCVKFGGEQVQIEELLIPDGHHRVTINVWLDTPLFCMNGVPPEKKESIQYSQILFIEIIFAKIGSTPQIKSKTEAPIYDSFGSLGFFLADLEKMDKIIKRELGTGSHDLVEVFSETELANKLFEAGVLCITWGITPWVYYVYSASEQSAIDQLPFNCARKISGTYTISDEVNTLSLIPGEHLKTWPACLAMQWPKINISGQGSTLKLDLHVRNFNPPNGSHGPIMAMFNIYRNKTNEEVSPLLNVDIETV